MVKKKVESKSILDCVCRKKVVECFLDFDNNYATKIARKYAMTYSHLLKLINVWRSENLIRVTEHKRKKVYCYTDKGKVVKRYLEKIVTRLNS